MRQEQTASPLKAEENEKKFKLLFLDIGLLQCALEIDPALFTATSFHQVNAGMLAEQFVGQELLACVDCYLDPHLFFWETEKGGDAQMVDFITNYHGNVVPIEVKAGKGGRLTSLRLFLAKKNIPIGLHISTQPFGIQKPSPLSALLFNKRNTQPTIYQQLVKILTRCWYKQAPRPENFG